LTLAVTVGSDGDPGRRGRRSPRHWTATEKDGSGTEIVSNGAGGSVPLARLYAVFGSSRQGTVTSRTSGASRSSAVAAASLHKACQTADNAGGGSSSKSTPTRRPASAYRRVNLPSYAPPPHSDVFVSNYARRTSAM